MCQRFFDPDVFGSLQGKVLLAAVAEAFKDRMFMTWVQVLPCQLQVADKARRWGPSATTSTTPRGASNHAIIAVAGFTKPGKRSKTCVEYSRGGGNA